MGESRRQAPKEDEMGIPPTQRMSQVGFLISVWSAARLTLQIRGLGLFD